MSSTTTDRVPEQSKPIPISIRRGRSHSISESSSSEESSSPSSPVSPLQSPLTQPRIAAVSPSATTPILSYFLSQSPKTPSAASTFPFRRGFGSAVFDDDSEPEVATPAATTNTTATHHRRATTAWAGAERFPPPQQPPAPAPVPDQTDRAVGLLRRLSLGGSALRPQVPPIKTTAAAAPVERASGTRTPPNTPAVERTARRTRRSQTLAAGTPRPKRAPSPMGERILTGHFDGFN